jgi:nucleotide-binding universal stress UspA family protein
MKILVAVDFSEFTNQLVDKAESIALAVSAKVWLLHVADPDPEFVGYEVGPQSRRDVLAEKYQIEHKQLQGFADRYRNAGLETVALLVQGATVETILKKASKIDADIIVVGSHGHGAIHQLIVGSVSEGVIHRSDYPILVIPTHKRT